MCNASLVELLVLTDTIQMSGEESLDSGKVGRDAVAVVTLLRYAKLNDQETQSVPLNLLFVLEQRLKENWSTKEILDPLANSQMLRLPGHSKAVPPRLLDQAVGLFNQWQHDAVPFLAIAVQYSLTRYVVHQLEAARQALRNHRTLGKLLKLALDPFPSELQNIPPIPSPKIVAKLLELTKPRYSHPILQNTFASTLLRLQVKILHLNI
jgi:hypothetical protein